MCVSYSRPQTDGLAPVDLHHRHDLVIAGQGPEMLESGRAVAANTVLHQNCPDRCLISAIASSVLNPTQDFFLFSGAWQELLHASAVDFCRQPCVVPVPIEGP